MVKKFTVLSLLAFSATQVVAVESADSRFNFVSGGVAFDSNSFVKEMVKKGTIAGNFGQEVAIKKSKHSSLGAYLSAAYSFDNNIFLEARLRYLVDRNNGYFAGVGYHHALNPQMDIYLLGGITQFDTPKSFKVKAESKTRARRELAVKGTVVSNDDLDKDLTSIKSKVAPSIEVGLRSMLNDALGLQAAYRLSKEKMEFDFPVLKAAGNNDTKSTKRGFSHEFSLGAYYHFTPQLAAEIGYSYHMVKLKGTDVIKQGVNHRGNVGLRYAF